MMTFLLTLACNGFAEDTGETATTDTGPVEVLATEHCGKLTEDETWSAGLHTVSCDVQVNGGTLTIEPGAVVEFKQGKGLLVAQDQQAATLVVNGAELGPDSTTEGVSWSGVSFSAYGEGSLRDTTLAMAGAGLKGAIVINGTSVLLAGVSIDGSKTDGIHLRNGGTLAADSSALAVTGAEGYPVVVDAVSAHTLVPGEYTGNGVDRVFMRGDDVTGDVVWVDLGVPWLVDGAVRFLGTADAPAGLTVGAGVEFNMNNASSMVFGPDGGAASVTLEGTVDAPVRLSGYGSDEPGYWKGLVFRPATTSAFLRYVVIEDTGKGADAAVVIDDTEVLLDRVSILDSSEPGLGLEGTGSLAEGSGAIVISNCEFGGFMPPEAVSRLPSDTVLSDLGEDIIAVRGGTDVQSSGTWSDLGVAYRIDVVVKVDGTADEPADLVLAPGVELLFRNDKGLYFSQLLGASSLTAVGTEAEPIVLRGYDSAEPGSWYGLGVFDNALFAELDHVVIDGAGGNKLDGNLHVEESAVTLGTVTLSNSGQWGAYFNVPAADLPSLEGVTFDGNAKGPWTHVDL